MKTISIEVTAEALSAVELFNDLPLHDRKLIADKCRGLKFDTDNIIMSHNDIDNDVYFILSGKVRIIIYSVSGKEIVFRDQSAGEMFGEIAALDNKPRSAHVIALSETNTAAMSAENFLWVLELYPSIMTRTLAQLAKLVRLLSERVIEFSSLGVRNRIHAELLRLAWQNMDNVNRAMISPAPKHVEIASRISTHREAITRELKQLASSGLIQKGKNELIINDVVKLENMVQDVVRIYKK